MYELEQLPDTFTYADLKRMGKPDQADQPEQFPHWLFDTQLFTFGAGNTTDLFYFQAVNPDKTLNNMPNQAMLPSEEYFWPQRAMFDPLFQTEVAAATPVSQYEEINRLVHTTHPYFVFSIKSKKYGEWPLSICHASGGAVGGGAGVAVGPLIYSSGQNSVPDGGAPVKGIPIIPPMTAFVVQCHWNATVAVIVAATVLCRFTFAGQYYRQVA